MSKFVRFSSDAGSSSSRAPSISSSQDSFHSVAETAPSSVYSGSIKADNSSALAYPNRPTISNATGASLSANDRIAQFTSTSGNFTSGLNDVRSLYTGGSSKASLMDRWMSSSPDGATPTGDTPQSLATGLQRLDREYAGSSIKSDIDAWSCGVSSVGDELTDSDSARSVVGDNDRSEWDEGVPYQGGFIGNQADRWSGKNGLFTDGCPVSIYSYLSDPYRAHSQSFVEEGSVVEEDENESTIEDYHDVVRKGFRARDDSRPPRSALHRNNTTRGSSAVSNLPDWKSYASVSDVAPRNQTQTQTQTARSTVQPKSILKKTSSFAQSSSPLFARPHPSSSLRQSSTANSRPVSRFVSGFRSHQPQPAAWHIQSSMRTFLKDASDWQSKADIAYSQGRFSDEKTFVSLANASIRKWRGANRQLQEMTGETVTVYDYKSEITDEDLTLGAISFAEIALDLEKNSAKRWSDAASKYASEGDGHMHDWCTHQSRAASWKADEMEREMNVKKGVGEQSQRQYLL